MSETNPYQAPAANLAREPDIGSFQFAGPRAVPIGHGWGWIAGGFNLFTKNPGIWILTVIVGLIIYIALYVTPFIGKFAIMGTSQVWIAGIILGCRSQDRGGEFKLEHLFDGFSSKPGQLILLSIFMSIIAVSFWFVMVGPVYLDVLTTGPIPDHEVMKKFNEKMAESSGIMPLYLLAMLISIPVHMTVWFTSALIVLNDVPILRAMKLSFIGCLKNILPFLLYFILAIVFCFLSLIPLFLGLLVFVPTMFGSFYAAYDDIYIEH